MELTIEEIKLVLGLIKMFEADNGFIPDPMKDLREKIRYEFGL